MKRSITSSGVQRATEILLAVCTLFLIVLVYVRMEAAPLLYDEVFHYQRITAVLQRVLPPAGWGVMFPGYHLLTAGLLTIVDQTSIPAARMVSLLFGLLACGVAYGVARAVDRPTALLRTLQFATLPILLPFFPLIYTDTLSLSLVLFALLAALHARLLLVGLFFLLASCVRQNNILWAPLLFAILLEAEPEWRIVASGSFAWLRAAVARLHHPHALRAVIRLTAPFLLPVCGFALFVAMMGRASFSPDLAAAHPFPSFSLGNIYFTLFLFTALFLPLVLVRARSLVRLLSRPWILLLLVALFVLFSAGFRVDHPANSEVGRFRDVILLAAAAGGTAGFVFWFAGALAVLTMLATPLSRRSFLWIYPLALLYLGGSWLIETRYALVPIVLFLLLRKPNSWRIEILQFACNIILLTWVFS
ncbi:MAG: hypothetical protein PHX93_02800 [Candidatus Peribacteraceae bacterium]|nr:hypothetical protein [Candidatus Peribacteraceae bacterium]